MMVTIVRCEVFLCGVANPKGSRITVTHREEILAVLSCQHAPATLLPSTRMVDAEKALPTVQIQVRCSKTAKLFFRNLAFHS